MRNLLYYKYVPINDPILFKQQHLDLCNKLGIKGKILVATEGINGCVSGTQEATEAYKNAMHSDMRFADLEFKEGVTERHNFKRIMIKVRKEIITSRLKIDMKNKAPYIEPQELKALLDKKEEIVLVDVRNTYESEIGHFSNAIPLQTKTFGELPKILPQLKGLENKQIVTYCTGGIRCEKASAYFRQNGFTNVRQLHGGIIRYGEECGNAHWEGKCFVFDNRGAIDIDPKKQSIPITQCANCFLPCDEYHQCANRKCDKMYISCANCIRALDHCCSKDCREKAKKQTKPSDCNCRWKK